MATGSRDLKLSKTIALTFRSELSSCGGGSPQAKTCSLVKRRSLLADKARPPGAAGVAWWP